MSKSTRALFFIALPLFLTIGLSIVLQATIVSRPEVTEQLLTSFGPYFLIGYVLLQSLTIIIAPLGGGFLQVALLALLGPEKALLLTYVVVTPIYLINFWIARTYGKRVVVKVIGAESLEKLDRFIYDSGTATLVILKVFQGGNFDYLSYVYGLSSVSFRTFFFVNLIAGIPSLFLAYLIYSSTDTLIAGVGSVYLVSSSLGMLAVSLVYFIRKRKAPSN